MNNLFNLLINVETSYFFLALLLMIPAIVFSALGNKGLAGKHAAKYTKRIYAKNLREHISRNLILTHKGALR